MVVVKKVILITHFWQANYYNFKNINTKQTNSIFIILLKFTANKSQASEFMVGHNEWIEQGFKDGVFLVVGSHKPNLGEGILVHVVRNSGESRK